MAASRNDSAFLAASALFQNRVRQSLVAACIAIASEAVTAAYHYKRAGQVVAILNNPEAYKTLFAYTVATDTLVLGDATQAGTVALNGTNVDAQQVLVTDAHIDAAVSAQFNAFFNPT